MGAKTKRTATNFDALMASAVTTLRLALDTREADNLWLSVWRERDEVQVEILWEERELAGTLAGDGVVKLGRKP